MKPLISSIACLALAACVADQDTTGQVSLPVTTVGSDGATYRLPPATRLGLAGSPTPNYDVSLDGDAAIVTFVAAEGSYQADIHNTDHNYTTVWPLVRTTTNGTTSTIDATLVTPVPLPATVVASETTSLTFQFSIASGGTVTFGHGSVSVSIGVGKQSATSFALAAQGGGVVVGVGVDGPYAPQLAAAPPDVCRPQLMISVGANVIGPWQEAGGSIDADAMSLAVCAPIQLTSSTGSGHTGFADLIAEAGHGLRPASCWVRSRSAWSTTATAKRLHPHVARGRCGDADLHRAFWIPTGAVLERPCGHAAIAHLRQPERHARSRRVGRHALICR